jgi:hypothetical protein
MTTHATLAHADAAHIASPGADQTARLTVKLPTRRFAPCVMVTLGALIRLAFGPGRRPLPGPGRYPELIPSNERPKEYDSWRQERESGKGDVDG